MKDKKVPSDLLVVVGLMLLTDIFVFTPELNESMLRNIFGLLLVLFLPGYALVAALFPEKSDLDGIERITLSFGLSIAVVPLIGLGLNYTQWGVRLFPIMASLSIFTIIICGLAYIRRGKLSEADAFEVSFRQIASFLKVEIFEKPASGMDKILTIFLAISILLLVTTLMYVVLTPKEGEHFTEFYILGPEGKADNYPTEYTFGENRSVMLGIVNHEYRTINYTMEVKLQNNSVYLPKNIQQIQLAHNETWQERINITPSFQGKNMKLEFLLFKENEKEIPYRDLHLWIDVNPTNAAKVQNH